MKVFSKFFALSLASMLLASCGGGGGGSQSSLTPTPADSITITPSASSITTDSFTSLTVSVAKADGTPESDGTTVTASLSPSTIGTLSGTTGTAAGTTATNTLAGGKTTFNFTSSNQTGTAAIAISLPAGLNGNPNGVSRSTSITVTQGNGQDPRLQLSATSTTLPLNPFAGESEVAPFPGNYIGSPYIAEVTVTWRHSNGQLVAGTLPVNVSIDPVTIAGFSELDDPTTQQTDPTKATGNEFLTILGSGPVNVTGGNGVIFVHAFDTPGQATLTVTAIDPDNAQTISSQLVFTVAGAASSLPTSISVAAEGSVYTSGSGGPQSVQIQAVVSDGNDAQVPDPSGFDNVEFQVVGPAGNDARLTGLNAAGQSVTGTTVNTVTHNGIATVTFEAGTVQGPVQVQAVADRGDNNVDNSIQDPVSATATVVVSDGKLFSLTIDSPDSASVVTSGVSGSVTEDPAGSGNYELAITAKGVDRLGNPVLEGTQVGFGDIDTPQLPSAATGPRGWFLISGSHGDPAEGGSGFSATDGHFKTAGGGSGPGDALLVIGKQSEGAPAGNDDLETAVKITQVISDTSLTVATPFNLNDTTGSTANYGPVLPYIIGRATFSSIQSPSLTDVNTSNAFTGLATTVLSYPASEIGKAVAIWADGTGTDTNSSPGRTDVVADVATLVFPGVALDAFIIASPDPISGNVPVTMTVCYYDGNNRPIPNFDISFAFELNGIGSGSADGVVESGKLKNLTGANGCTTTAISTSSIPPSGASIPTLTFSAGPQDPANPAQGQAAVTIPILVDVAQLAVGCASGTAGTGTEEFNITLTLLDSQGKGVGGELLTGSCTVTSATGSAAVGSIVPTDANGATIASVTLSGAATTAHCVFLAPTPFTNLAASVNLGTAANAGSCTGTGGFSPP